MARHDGDLRWAKVRTVRAAVLKWHERRQLTSILQDWTPRVRAVCSGFKKQRKHAGNGKEPVSFDEVTTVASNLDDKSTPIELRNIAMILKGFFGVRRGAEIVALKLQDVEHMGSNGVRLRIASQKNDPCGVGQVCFIPAMPALGQASPCVVLSRWLEARINVGGSQASHSPLFTTITARTRAALSRSTDYGK